MKIQTKLFVSVALAALSVTAFAHNSRIRDSKVCFVEDAFHGQRVTIRHEVDLDEECRKYTPMFDLDCTEDLTGVELADAAECVTSRSEIFVDAPKLTQAGRQVRIITHFASDLGKRECTALPRPARLNCVRWNPQGAGFNSRIRNTD